MNHIEIQEARNQEPLIKDNTKDVGFSLEEGT